MIPLYTHPTDGTWAAVIRAKKAYPDVPFVAIINPDSGPGTSQDQNYESGIKDLQAAGVVVLGYVTTGYATSSYSALIDLEPRSERTVAGIMSTASSSTRCRTSSATKATTRRSILM
jgi:hypothetical protein